MCKFTFYKKDQVTCLGESDSLDYCKGWRNSIPIVACIRTDALRKRETQSGMQRKLKGIGNTKLYQLKLI